MEISAVNHQRQSFILLINVKIVGILTFMSMINFMLSRVEHESFYNLWPKYLEVELKASIVTFRFSFARDLMKSFSHSKIETDQQQRGHTT